MSIRKIVRVLFPFAAAGLLAACSKSEEFTPNVPNPTNDEVVFALQVPGGNSATRSLTGPDEYAVETLDVLVFDHNTGAFLSRGFNKTEPSVVGGVVSFYVGIVPEPGVTKYDYILLANARDAIRTCLENSNGEIPRSYTKTSIQADLKANVVAGTGWIVDKSNLNYKAMPMWGEINDQELNKGANYNGTLTRMTTRVDLEVDLEGDSAGDTFTLNQVKLHNYFTTGYVIPKASQWNSSTQKPIGSSAAGLRPSTPPTPIDYSSKIVSNKIEYSIYTFETTTEDYSTDACLLVNATWTPAGGTAKTGWYRLDFVNTDKTTHANTPFTLTRNHHYQMAVTMINGPGFLNESEALASLPGTIETRVQTWVPGDMGDVVFDGTNYLRVNQKEWEIDREPRTDADTDNKLEIETDCSEWKITAVTETDGTTPCTWLTPSVLQGGPGASTISLNATANKDAGAVDRTAFVHIQAGRLKFKVEVTQLNRTKAFVRITDMSGDPISELFFRANNGTPDMAPDPQYFKVEWSPKDQPLKMLRTPIGNPFECWNWVNVINGWTEIPASYNGSYSFTIDPYPITTAQIAGDPFYSKASMLKLIVDGGGGSTADANILLQQANFALIPEGFLDAYGSKLTRTAKVKSNVAWEVTVTSGESALVSYGPRRGSANMSGAEFTYTAKPGEMSEVTFTFTSPENLFDPVPVTITTGAIASRFARSNIVLIDQGLPTERLGFAVTKEDNATIPANVQGVDFKWGSLIGVTSPGTPGTNVTPFLPEHIVFVPEEHLFPIPTSINDIPYTTKTNSTDYYTINIFQNMFSGKNYDADSGRGDICSYISDKKWVEGRWRIPTGEEYEILYDETVEALGSSSVWTDINTVHMGVNYLEISTNVSDGSYEIPSGQWFGGGIEARVTPSVENRRTPPSGTIFLPASGMRDDVGMVSTGKIYQYHSASQKGYLYPNGIGVYTVRILGGYTDPSFQVTTILSVMNSQKINPVRCIRDE